MSIAVIKTGSSPFWNYYLKQSILRCKPTAVAVGAQEKQSKWFLWGRRSILCLYTALLGQLVRVGKLGCGPLWQHLAIEEVGALPFWLLYQHYQGKSSRAVFPEEDPSSPGWRVALLRGMAFLQDGEKWLTVLWSYQYLWVFNWC